MKRYDLNPKINQACINLIEKQKVIDEAAEALIQVATQEFQREQGVKINKTILLIPNGKNGKSTVKGLVTSLNMEKGVYPNGDDFFQFSWVCRLINKDGKLSKTIRYWDVENLPDIFGELESENVPE